MDITAMGSHNYNTGTHVHQVSKLSKLTGKGKQIQNTEPILLIKTRPHDEPKPQE